MIGFYVPTPTKDIAIAIIGETLEATLDSNIRILDLTVKYFFVEPEHTTKGTKSHKINYEITIYNFLSLGIKKLNSVNH